MTAGTIAAAGGGPSPLWYATRATGAMALVMLTATVVLGIMGMARFATPRWPRMITSGLHRNMSLLVVCFLGVHVLTALLDTFAPVGLASVLVPFASAYRPLWLGLGTLASDLVVALVLTSLLRARLGLRAWRAVHWLAYAAWPVALWHGLGTGSDARLPLMLGIDAVCAAAVLAAVGWRLFLVPDPARRLAAAAAMTVLPLATIVFAAAGPLQAGWAARAGTPASLLGHGAAASGAAAVPRSPAAGTATPAPASGRFTGTYSQRGGEEGQSTITITGRTSGGTRQDILLTLHGPPLGNGPGIDFRTGRLTVIPPGSGGGYSGPVRTVDGALVTASVTGPGGYRALIRVLVRHQGSAASGQIDVRAGGTS